MKTRILVLVLSLFIICPAQLKFSDDDETERTKYGMSQSEWQMFKESGLSVTQLEKLLECGISMGEYSSRPWLSLGVAEKDWIAERCKGMVDEDIQAFHERGDNDFSIILAFLLPGSYHWAKHSYPTAAALSSVAVISLSLFFLVPQQIDEPAQATVGNTNMGQTTTTESKQPVFLVITLADMILSSVLAYKDWNKTKSGAGGEPEQKSEPKPEPKSSLKLDFKGNRPTVNWAYRF
jgi:hypothetical protein